MSKHYIRPILGLPEGSNLLTEPNTGIEGFDDEGMWGKDENPESSNRDLEAVYEQVATLATTLEKYIRHVWSYHGDHCLNNPDDLSDAEFDGEEVHCILQMKELVVNAEKRKKL